jgi:hypothetical protein
MNEPRSITIPLTVKPEGQRPSRLVLMNSFQNHQPLISPFMNSVAILARSKLEWKTPLKVEVWNLGREFDVAWARAIFDEYKQTKNVLYYPGKDIWKFLDIAFEVFLRFEGALTRARALENAFKENGNGTFALVFQPMRPIEDYICYPKDGSSVSGLSLVEGTRLLVNQHYVTSLEETADIEKQVGQFVKEKRAVEYISGYVREIADRLGYKSGPEFRGRLEALRPHRDSIVLVGPPQNLGHVNDVDKIPPIYQKRDGGHVVGARQDITDFEFQYYYAGQWMNTLVPAKDIELLVDAVVPSAKSRR